MVLEEGFELFHAFRALDLRRALRGWVIEVLPQRAVPTAAVGGVVEQLGSVRSGGGGKWCAKRDLNPRPPRCKRDALPLSYSRIQEDILPSKRVALSTFLEVSQVVKVERRQEGSKKQDVKWIRGRERRER